MRASRGVFLLGVLALAGCGTGQAADDAGTDGATNGDAGFDATGGDATSGDANVPDDGAAPADAGCGTGVLTQLSASAGPVVSGTIAHAGNGSALAVWTQLDSNDGGSSGAVYAAEHQGCTWGAPVAIQKGTNMNLVPHPPTLVANDSTFVILPWLGGPKPPEVWTGSGVTAASGSFASGLLGTDGATFVDVMQGPQTGYSSTTSTDGLTWSSPQQAETVGAFEYAVASGPEGVMAWAYDQTAKQERARVWHQGAWSAPALLSSYGNGACQAAVAETTALIACLGPNPGDGGPDYLDVQLFDGSWHDLPPPKQPGAATVVLVATDGTDYRLDYGNNPPVASVLHAGAWSTPANDGVSAHGTAGRAGAWTAVQIDVNAGYSIARATGAAGFPAATSLVPQPIAIGTWIGLFGAPFSGWPGRTDVAFVEGDGQDGGAETLYVGLDL